MPQVIQNADTSPLILYVPLVVAFAPPMEMASNHTSNTTEDCTLHYFRIWPSSCSESWILHYKWITFSLGLAFTILLSAHFKNLMLRIIRSKFIFNRSDTNLYINLLGTAAAMCGVLNTSNYLGSHHNGLCVSSVAYDLTTALLIVIS